LLEHCLWYFVRSEGVPKIIVEDTDKSINLNDLYDSYMCESAHEETITIKDHVFDLTHIKFRALSSKKHGISLCAASRLVKEEAIAGKIPGLYGKISDHTGEFTYSCYVASPYLDERVRAEHASFDIYEDVDGILSSTGISLRDIREQVLERAGEYLKEYLEDNIEAARSRVEKFVSEKASHYRPIVSRMGEDDLVIDPSISDKYLDLYLHRKLAELEETMRVQGHDIMAMFEGDYDDYTDRLSEYLRTAYRYQEIGPVQLCLAPPDHIGST